MSGYKEMEKAISKDLLKRLPKQRATQRRKLGELVAGMLVCQSPNLMELSNVLDRPTESAEVRYNYVERFLKNPLVKPLEIMASYGKDILERLCAHQEHPVLMIDQTKANDSPLEILVVSVRVRKRAMPLVWKVKNTSGPIGFAEQKDLLESVIKWLPNGTVPMLAGDRFYGTTDLVNWCQEKGWKYRLRLKGNLCCFQDIGEDKSLETLHREQRVTGQKLRFRAGMITHVGVLHEPGHKEPWYIAMDSEPNKWKTLDYGMRWGIESMFSDFKSRGFSLTDTRIKFADRLERLLLILSVALHWAISVGLFREKHNKDHAEKRDPKKPTDHLSRFLSEAYALCDDAFSTICQCQLYGCV